MKQNGIFIQCHFSCKWRCCDTSKARLNSKVQTFEESINQSINPRKKENELSLHIKATKTEKTCNLLRFGKKRWREIRHLKKKKKGTFALEMILTATGTSLSSLFLPLAKHVWPKWPLPTSFPNSYLAPKFLL